LKSGRTDCGVPLVTAARTITRVTSPEEYLIDLICLIEVLVYAMGERFLQVRLGNDRKRSTFDA
jgi:hypothetical protein